MGLFLSKAFIPPDDLLGCFTNMTGVEEGEEGVVECLAPFSEPDWYWGFTQVMTLMVVYGAILFYASNMLSSGSELLLLVPSLAGIVGSVVLPILGAVPDGAIMLFSGLGPNAQSQLTVGIGTIAGSTIMLLTIPWAGSIYLGRVPIGVDGVASYKRRRVTTSETGPLLTGFGVTPEPSIRSNAIIMVVTSLIYLVIQGPAMPYATNSSPDIIDEVAAEEHNFALAGLILAVLAFIGYIVLMMNYDSPNKDYLINAMAIKAIEDNSLNGSISLSGIIAPIIATSAMKAQSDSGQAFLSGQGLNRLLDDKGKARLENLLKPFFKRYDANGDGRINAAELRDLLRDLREEVTPEEANLWMAKLDPDQSGAIETDQFTDAMLNYIQEKARKQAGYRSMYSPPVAPASAPGVAPAEEDEVEDEEEEEMPDDLATLSPEEQQKMIKRRAAKLMVIGLALILVFSDPMVDVMSNVGERLGVPPFYVSFILAPLASNASELIASLNYAAKKTRKTITVSLSALEGAACMNNTFCLAIFMALIYFKGLAWKYSAETLAILIVEVLIAIIAMQQTQKIWHAILALALFPGSLVLVSMLEANGFD